MDTSDIDGDGVIDGVDNCPNAFNPEQWDYDGDGVGDTCDECTDSDGDGFGNPGFAINTCPDDNCPDDPNPDQSDRDNDGTGDDCDDCTDSDYDGFGDPGFPANICATDNCPDVFNPAQADHNEDGIGDACSMAGPYIGEYIVNYQPSGPEMRAWIVWEMWDGEYRMSLDTSYGAQHCFCEVIGAYATGDSLQMQASYSAPDTVAGCVSCDSAEDPLGTFTYAWAGDTLVLNRQDGNLDKQLRLVSTTCCRLRGDIDHDGTQADIADLVWLIDYMFSDWPAPPCDEEADVNGSGGIDIADMVFLVEFMFLGGPAPTPCF